MSDFESGLATQVRLLPGEQDSRSEAVSAPDGTPTDTPDCARGGAQTVTASAHDVEARALVDLRERKYALDHENAQRCGLAWDDPERLTGAHIDASIALGDELDSACEAFRRRHYPRAGRVVTALGTVSVLSKQGRRMRIVFDQERVR